MERHWECEGPILERSVWIKLRGGWVGGRKGQRDVDKGRGNEKRAVETSTRI